MHVDAVGKSNHTNRTCKFINDLKADPEAGYKRSWKTRPRGKVKAKKEAKESSDLEEDESKLAYSIVSWAPQH
jgi:hypothetical protein